MEIMHRPHLNGSQPYPCSGPGAELVIMVANRTRPTYRPETLVETFTQGEGVYCARVWWEWGTSTGNHECAHFRSREAAVNAGVRHALTLANSIIADIERTYSPAGYVFRNGVMVSAARRAFKKLASVPILAEPPVFAKQATPAEARDMIDRLNAMECTKMMERAPVGSLFGAPEQTQLKLFAQGDQQPAPEFVPFVGTIQPRPKAGHPPSAGKWPPAWHGSTAADRRIAKLYQADSTDNLF